MCYAAFFPFADCVKKIWLFIGRNVKQVVNLTMFLRQKKKTNKQTNTKGYRVLDVMLCNPKGSLHVTNLWVPILQRNHDSQHKNRPNSPYG